MTSAQKLANLFAELGPAEFIVGDFVDTNADGSVEVDFGDGAVTVLSALNYTPLAGVSVRCLRIKGGALMLGEANPVAIIGTVTATGSPLLTVTTSVGSQELPYLASYDPRNTNDEVVIFGGYVLGKPSATLAGSYTAPAAATTDYQVDFRATDSGSWNGTSWWTTQPWASNSNKGAWFYGGAVGDTIPDGAEITRVQAYLPRFYDGFPAELAAVGLHVLAAKSGSLSLSSPTAIAAGSGWYDLPTSFGDSLKTGASTGIGVQQNNANLGYHKFRSISEDADSGLLRIDWTV